MSHPMMTRSTALVRRNPPVPKQKLIPVAELPKNVHLVYEFGAVAGEDEETNTRTIRESIRVFNEHSAIQLKCGEL